MRYGDIETTRQFSVLRVRIYIREFTAGKRGIAIFRISEFCLDRYLCTFLYSL